MDTHTMTDAELMAAERRYSRGATFADRAPAIEARIELARRGYDYKRGAFGRKEWAK